MTKMLSALCSATNVIPTVFEEVQMVMSEEALMERTRDCASYMRGLFSRFENNSYPIGFAFSMHHQPAILELFLASSFHPQDSYCFHLDPKAPKGVQAAFLSLIRCYQESFPNSTLILVPDPVPVFWAHFSVLQADLKCMRALRQADSQWKTYINPAATELPLHPLGQIRRTLRLSNDSIVDSDPVPQANMLRFDQAMGLVRNGANAYDFEFRSLGKTKAPPPMNIVMRKGSKNVALKRDFVDFILESAISWTLLDWLQDALVPDEHFFSTLITLFNNNTDMVTIQDLSTDHTHGGCVRLSWWYDTQCQGSNVRDVCNFGMGDLKRLQWEPNCMSFNNLVPLSHLLALIGS
eukprot:maker-scaffold205_size259573-snap-gene-1.44 protein:Tk01394 transcript:maker-scaffold205_size259573-snap-gene-1.44-mRNA-1 annotation:"beta- -galactosyl-o-glycosyl-glycoprotein beta- -n-acetylglucosaminyltransferase isoform x2"